MFTDVERTAIPKVIASLLFRVCSLPCGQLIVTRLTPPLAAVFLIYEFVVTFDREVACFWTGKWNGASLLFFANKGVSVTLSVMTLSRFAHFPSDEVSNINAYLGQI